MRRNYSRLLIVALVVLAASCSDEDNIPGINPPADDRFDFVGTWTVVESPVAQSFIITITLRGNGDSITISNFAGFGSVGPHAYGLVSGNSLTVPGQDITPTALHVQGTGVLNSAGTKITMDYVADGDTITATATKN